MCEGELACVCVEQEAKEAVGGMRESSRRDRDVGENQRAGASHRIQKKSQGSPRNTQGREGWTVDTARIKKGIRAVGQMDFVEGQRASEQSRAAPSFVSLGSGRAEKVRLSQAADGCSTRCAGSGRQAAAVVPQSNSGDGRGEEGGRERAGEEGNAKEARGAQFSAAPDRESRCALGIGCSNGA